MGLAPKRLSFIWSATLSQRAARGSFPMTLLIVGTGPGRAGNCVDASCFGWWGRPMEHDDPADGWLPESVAADYDTPRGTGAQCWVCNGTSRR